MPTKPAKTDPFGTVSTPRSVYPPRQNGEPNALPITSRQAAFTQSHHHREKQAAWAQAAPLALRTVQSRADSMRKRRPWLSMRMPL